MFQYNPYPQNQLQTSNFQPYFENQLYNPLPPIGNSPFHFANEFNNQTIPPPYPDLHQQPYNPGYQLPAYPNPYQQLYDPGYPLQTQDFGYQNSMVNQIPFYSNSYAEGCYIEEGLCTENLSQKLNQKVLEKSVTSWDETFARQRKLLGEISKNLEILIRNNRERTTRENEDNLCADKVLDKMPNREKLLEKEGIYVSEVLDEITYTKNLAEYSYKQDASNLLDEMPKKEKYGGDSPKLDTCHLFDEIPNIKSLIKEGVEMDEYSLFDERIYKETRQDLVETLSDFRAPSHFPESLRLNYESLKSKQDKTESMLHNHTTDREGMKKKPRGGAFEMKEKDKNAINKKRKRWKELSEQIWVIKIGKSGEQGVRVTSIQLLYDTGQESSGVESFKFEDSYIVESKVSVKKIESHGIVTTRISVLAVEDEKQIDFYTTEDVARNVSLEHKREEIRIGPQIRDWKEENKEGTADFQKLKVGLREGNPKYVNPGREFSMRIAKSNSFTRRALVRLSKSGRVGEFVTCLAIKKEKSLVVEAIDLIKDLFGIENLVTLLQEMTLQRENVLSKLADGLEVYTRRSHKEFPNENSNAELLVLSAIVDRNSFAKQNASKLLTKMLLKALINVDLVSSRKASYYTTVSLTVKLKDGKPVKKMILILMLPYKEVNHAISIYENGKVLEELGFLVVLFGALSHNNGALNTFKKCVEKLELYIKPCLISSVIEVVKFSNDAINYHQVTCVKYQCVIWILSGVIQHLNGELYPSNWGISLKVHKVNAEFLSLLGSAIRKTCTQISWVFIKSLINWVHGVQISVIGGALIGLLFGSTNPQIIPPESYQLLGFRENVRKQVAAINWNTTECIGAFFRVKTVQLVARHFRDYSLLGQEYIKGSLADIRESIGYNSEKEAKEVLNELVESANMKTNCIFNKKPTKRSPPRLDKRLNSGRLLLFSNEVWHRWKSRCPLIFGIGSTKSISSGKDVESPLASEAAESEFQVDDRNWNKINAHSMGIHKGALKKPVWMGISALYRFGSITQARYCFGRILDKVESRHLHHLLITGPSFLKAHAASKHFKDDSDWLERDGSGRNNLDYDSASTTALELHNLREHLEEQILAFWVSLVVNNTLRTRCF